MLESKNILLGITGGIAAYKSAELIRLLVKEKANVKAVMTKNACNFITPLTIQTLSNNKVFTDMFNLDEEFKIGHISLASFADILVVAPATANIIGKFAHGIADDLLSTIYLATKAPVIVAPSMNVNMYENFCVQENLASLRKRGVTILEPDEGELACKVIGKGRMVEPFEILSAIKYRLSNKDLYKEKIIVTAGPTIEPIDPIRYITNRSSGKMGYKLAECASRRGADVLLIHGPTNLPLPYGVKEVKVETADQMYNAIIDNIKDVTIIIKSAAVADFKVASIRNKKIKKEEFDYILKLEKNLDILSELTKNFPNNKVYVGFAAETENLIDYAKTKLKQKRLDLIVANDVSNPLIGFGSDINKVYLIDKHGLIEDIPLGTKEEIADKILDKIIKLKSS